MREEAKGSITLGGQEIPTVHTVMKQSELRFYAENPRIYSLVFGVEEQPSQHEIEEKLCSADHVKQLAQSIVANGGLIDPLIVHAGTRVVFEGNSRLAAYRLLCRNEPVKWGQVKCTMLPEDISEDKIFALLGEYHIIGRKDWAPYEQAGYLYRRRERQKISEEAMAQEVGLSRTRISKLIEVYAFMVDHDEPAPQRWSYYEEYFKGRKIKQAREFHPDMDSVIVSKVKSGEISKATDIRDKVTPIAGSKGKLLRKFLNNTNSLEKCYEQATAGGASNVIYRRLNSFRASIADAETKALLKRMTNEPKQKCKFELKRIKARVNELLHCL